MSAAIDFQLPAAWIGALPVVLVILVAASRQRQRGFSYGRILPLAILRGVPLLVLVFLAARPVHVTQASLKANARPVMVLVDRSESMSLREGERNRYERAVDFLNQRLAPALKSAGLPAQGVLFDQSSESAAPTQIREAKPAGKRTNLGGAIAQALNTSGRPPLAVIALTDGIANENSDDSRALGALTAARVPFIGVGFGSDQGVQTLSLMRVEAPKTVTPRTVFNLSAELQLLNAHDLAPFDLVLFRDGQVLEHKSVRPGNGSRTWLENFQLSGQTEGAHEYSVQLLPPNEPNLKCVSTCASASVKVSEEKEMRILYIQGALTWDYKFIGLSLRSDPALKLTGLTRTAKQSLFRQNVESAGELLHGFPESLDELAPFRVIVLSNLRPTDLSAAQQEILARFCGDLGGGVLLIGGPATFDGSWQGSRLEQLLPVIFAADAGADLEDKPFHLELTDAAAADPVFQIAESGPVREPWSHLPAFTRYGKVEAAKMGARIWMVHPSDEGPRGRRILMASQRFGAGLSAVLCVQNFWRWRLAKKSEPEQFDRFWRQLFRRLGGAGSQEVNIQLAQQELRPGRDIEVVLEREASPHSLVESNRQFVVQVNDGCDHLLRQESVQLQPFQPVDFRFHAQKPDRYTVRVLDSAKAVIAEHAVEIRESEVEFEQTARNMETLRQWAGLTGGLAFKVEECPPAADLVAQIKARVEQVRQTQRVARTAGLTWWMLSILLGSLSAEWLLRKKWDLL